MPSYDYKAGKKRIEEILENKLEVKETGNIPNNSSFTFTNAYYGWVTGIFVDIRDSTSLFTKSDKELVSKVIRSFTSEVIEILRDDDNLREIGIRGDCVYAIYNTSQKDDIFKIVNNTFYLNTFMKMLNTLLIKDSFQTISVGIGISSAQELVVKAGRKDVGINNNIWIGDAVTKASNLSSLGNKQSYGPIVMSDLTYSNTIEHLKEVNGAVVETWFKTHYDSKLGTFYSANIIKTEFSKWINEGMK